MGYSQSSHVHLGPLHTGPSQLWCLPPGALVCPEETDAASGPAAGSLSESVVAVPSGTGVWGSVHLGAKFQNQGLLHSVALYLGAQGPGRW